MFVEVEKKLTIMMRPKIMTYFDNRSWTYNLRENKRFILKSCLAKKQNVLQKFAVGIIPIFLIKLNYAVRIDPYALPYEN